MPLSFPAHSYARVKPHNSSSGVTVTTCMILQLTDSVVVLTRNPYFSARAGKARHIFTACSFEHFIYSFSVITQSMKNIKHISYNSDTHTHTQHAKRKSLLVSFHTAKHSRSVNREKNGICYSQWWSMEMFEKSGQAQNYVLLISFPLPTKPLWDKCIFFNGHSLLSFVYAAWQQFRLIRTHT